MIVEFTTLVRGAHAPWQAHEYDAGYDLFACESATIAPGERVSVGTGIAVAIPERYAGLVLPRSGLAVRHGITLPNSPGLIDAGYRGELRVLLLNTDRRQSFEVRPGDRIAQLVITRLERLEFVAAAALSETARGDGGLGSTGVR